MRCVIKGCTSTHHNRNISFFKFPSDSIRQKAWITACRRDDIDINKGNNEINPQCVFKL